MESCRQPFGALLRGRQAEWHAGSLDALLRAANPLRHGRLGDQECVGNFRRSQTADGAQSQSNRRGRSEGGVAAHKQQDERVIWIYIRLDFDDGCHALYILRDRGFSLTTSNFAPHLVGHAAECDLDQPAAWILGDTLLRPLRKGRYRGLLHGVLGGGEVAKTASDYAEHLR